MSAGTSQSEAGPGARDTESRWPASLAIVAALVLYVTLPPHLLLGPPWLVPGLELALLIPLTVIAPRRTHDEAPWHRVAAIAIIAIINAANFVSLVSLVNFLIHNRATGVQLLFSSTAIWLTNIVVFALWYWELDGGGPRKRLSET